MKSVPLLINDSDLQAYVDCRLNDEQRVEFERLMIEHPEVAERVAAYSEQREALRVALQDKFNEPIPAHLRVDHIASGLSANRRNRGPVFATAAAWLLVGVIGGSAGTTMVARTSAPTAAYETRMAARPMADALAAHRVYVADVKHPIEVGADERAHLQTWLSKRVGRELTAPDLSVSGYKLLGGRLLAASSGPAALFMYENPKGVRMTVYVRSSADKDSAPVKLIDDRGLPAAYWYDGGYGFAVAAEDNRETVFQAAQAAQRQLTI